jgi:hypothetical protein
VIGLPKPVLHREVPALAGNYDHVVMMARPAAAPDAKPALKLRGKRQIITFGLPPELIAAVDAIAVAEKRSRAKMIEVILENFIREHSGDREEA